MFLNDVCSKRTIVGEVMSAASVILPYGLDCSPCLDVSLIKGWLIDVMIGRVITALRAAVLGIITPGETRSRQCAHCSWGAVSRAT